MRNPARFFGMLFQVFMMATTAHATLPGPPGDQKFVEGSTNDDYYSIIAERFRQAHLPINSDLSKLRLRWPLNDSRRRILSVFESPDVVKISANEDGKDVVYWTVIPHRAVDIARSSESVSPIVHSPVTGLAIIIPDESDPSAAESQESGSYASTVAIYEPISRAIVNLLHVKPRADFKFGAAPAPVQAGEAIGELASDIPCNPNLVENMRHTHVFLIDGSKGIRIRNPFKYFIDFKDSAPPIVDDVYLFDSAARQHSRLVDGKIDIVLKAHDTFDQGSELIPPAELSYRVWSDRNVILAKADRCQLGPHLYNPNSAGLLSVYSSYYDLMGSFDEATDEVWPNTFTPASQATRFYRLALTHLRTGQSSSCTLLSDPNGFLEITPDIQFIRVEAILRDRKGNTSHWIRKIER
jgi:hypothetical protein